MPSLVILGAGGFVGRAILAGPKVPMPVTAIARTIPDDADGGVKWVALDLLEAGVLPRELAAGDLVINLAFASDLGLDINSQLVEAVVSACVTARVARLVHCSTAAVFGNARTRHVDESTPCMPMKEYEHTKLALERRVLACEAGVDVGILRPTAIVGPGGQSLWRLARALQVGSPVVNYLRSSLYGRRAMHLVSFADVAAAAVHLALIPQPLDGGIYIVAADDSADNDFLRIEDILRAALGAGPRRFPPLPVPQQLLEALLRFRGRSDATVDRFYDSRKLRASGFTPVMSVREAIEALGRSLRQ